MDDKRVELWLKLGQFLIGTVVLGIATFAVNSQIQKKEVDIKEMEMLGKFIDHAIDGNVAVRQRFAEYFATVSRSEDIRDRWENYKKKIDAEFQRIENEAAELKKQKEQEMKEAEALRQQLVEAKINADKLASKFKKKNTLAESQINELENQINQQQRMLKEVQAKTFKRDDTLARVQSQLNEAKAEITYPIQRMQRQAPPKSGWVYLGEFDSSENIWKNTNWNFASESKPESLKGKAIRVSVDAVNVRSNSDPWAKILDVMKLNSTVHVESIKKWGDTGYFWAKVTY